MKNIISASKLEGSGVVEIGEHSETFGLGRYYGIKIVFSAGGSPREDLDIAVRLAFLLAHLGIWT
jgi:hypothetical protein